MKVFFFEEDALKIIRSLEKVKLPVVNDEIHCTFKYHPISEEIYDDLVGKEIEILLIGYVCDGKNSGFEIQLPNEIKKYYINYNNDNSSLITPHITASLAIGAKASDTKNLNFERLSKPYVIRGKFGYWIKEDNNEYVLYNPYMDYIGKKIK